MFSPSAKLARHLIKPGELIRSEPRSTGSQTFDAFLGGGLPVGQLTEISGAISSGKSTLAFAACQAALEDGRAAAWIDGSGGPRLWPLPALEANVRLEKLLVVRVRDGRAALKAAHLLLDCPGAIAVGIIELPPRFFPGDAALLKLQRLAERSGTAAVFLSENRPQQAALGNAIALRLSVRPRPARSLTRTLDIEVLRHKGGATRRSLQESLDGPDRLRVRGSL